MAPNLRFSLPKISRIRLISLVVVFSAAIGNGQQPYFAADRTIEQASSASNPHDLPELLHQAVVTQVFCNKVHTAMFDFDGLEGSASQSARSSLIKVLEHDLRELEGRLDTRTSRRSFWVCSFHFSC
jgi:hypothetical protein